MLFQFKHKLGIFSLRCIIETKIHIKENYNTITFPTHIYFLYKITTPRYNKHFLLSLKNSPYFDISTQENEIFES